MAAAFERIRAAELDEEARRHFSIDGEAAEKRTDDDENDPRVRVQGLNFDEKRKKRGRRSRDEDEDASEEEEPTAEDAAADAKAAGLVAADGAGKYFQAPEEDRLGDPNLLHPDEIRRVLGPAVRFAQHAMILADHRMQEGASRGEALEFLMNLYLGLSDRTYANRALRDFGPATGIVDIYPLELVDQLFAHVPAFFHRTRKGPVFSVSKELDMVAGVPATLRYPEGFRIRGFALQGGPRPGYLFEPTEDENAYRLVIQSAGTFTVLVSALTRDGWVQFDEILCRVAEGTGVMAAFDSRHRKLLDGDGPQTARPTKKNQDLSFHFPKRV